VKTFSTPNLKFKVHVSATSLNQILKYCELAGKQETGGILIGKYMDDQKCARITHASYEPPDSKKGATWFVRGYKGLQEWVDRIWKSGRGFYVGEWHFHPYASPIPSSVDISEMKRISINKAYNCPEPILIIFGGDPLGNWKLSVTVVTLNGVVRLQETNNHSQ
jgi:integrative and conjugative element protein (TIGR02256 family)